MLLKTTKERYDRLVELNVMQQVLNVCHTTLCKEHGQEADVYGSMDGYTI